MSICKKHTKQLVAHAAVTHTYCIRSSQRKDKKYVTSVPAQPQDKFNFFFPSLLCLNFFAIACRHQNRWTEIAKTITYIDLTRTKDRRPAYNSTYKKLAVQCSADTFLVNQTLILCINPDSYRDGKNRHLRQSANFYGQV